MMRDTDHECGFTVLELLVALCILALLSTYAIQAFHHVRRMDRVLNHVETRSAIDAVRQHLVKLISSARPIAVSAEARPAAIAFGGEQSRLEFIISADGTLETGGLQLVEITAQKRDDGLADLIAFRKPYRAGQAPVHGIPLLLLEKIAGLRIRYYGQVNGRQAYDWHSEWLDQSSLPRLLEIVITMPEDVRWKETRLIVHPASSL